MQKISGNCVNNKGWCWINGICLIYALDKKTKIIETPCKAYLKKLIKIFEFEIGCIKKKDTKIPKTYKKIFPKLCMGFIETYSKESFDESKFLRRRLQKKCKELLASNNNILKDLSNSSGWIAWFFEEEELLKYILSNGIHLVAVKSGSVCHAFTVFRIDSRVVINSNDIFYVYENSQSVDNYFLKDFFGSKYNFDETYVYTHISG